MNSEGDRTKTTNAVAGTLAIMAFDFLCCGGGFSIVPLTAIFYLCFGWISYLRRVIPQTQPDFGTIGLGIIACVVLVFGSHWMLCWFSDQVPRSSIASSDSQNSKLNAIDAHRRWQWRWTLMINVVVLLSFVAGTCMVGICHQVAWMANGPSLVESGFKEHIGLSKSSSNLNHIALGANAHQMLVGSFPAGTITDRQGNALHGWMTSLLPYMEMAAVYDKIDKKKPWNDATNRECFETRVGTFEYPYLSEDQEATALQKGFALSHYSGNSYLLGSQEGLTLEEIRDGTSNTILAGEVNKNLKPWGSPFQYRDPTLALDRDPQGFGSHRKRDGIVQFGMADGSVRPIRNNIDPKVLKALATPNGGEAYINDGNY